MARLVMETVRGVRNHFPNRAGEWLCSILLIDWGIRAWLYAHPDMRLWAAVVAVIGFARFAALAINGTFYKSLWYSRRSPHIRSAMAYLSIFVWMLIAVGVWRYGADPIDQSIYLAAFDFYNAVRAGRDAGSLDGSYAGARREPVPAT